MVIEGGHNKQYSGRNSKQKTLKEQGQGVFKIFSSKIKVSRFLLTFFADFKVFDFHHISGFLVFRDERNVKFFIRGHVISIITKTEFITLYQIKKTNQAQSHFSRFFPRFSSFSKFSRFGIHPEGRVSGELLRNFLLVFLIYCIEVDWSFCCENSDHSKQKILKMEGNNSSCLDFTDRKLQPVQEKYFLF